MRHRRESVRYPFSLVRVSFIALRENHAPDCDVNDQGDTESTENKHEKFANRESGLNVTHALVDTVVGS